MTSVGKLCSAFIIAVMAGTLLSCSANSGSSPASDRSASAGSSVDNAQDPWPLTDTFATPPPRAHAAPGSSCVTAQRYLDMTTGKGALFAEDAVFLTPEGQLVRGRKAITAWFDNPTGLKSTPSSRPSASSSGSPSPGAGIPLSFTASGHECYMEVASYLAFEKNPQYRLLVVDHFTMNDQGEIARAVFYFRPAALALAQSAAPTPR